MGSQQTGQVAGEGTRVLGMRAETGGLMGGEMGVGQTTRHHGSRPCGSCRATQGCQDDLSPSAGTDTCSDSLLQMLTEGDVALEWALSFAWLFCKEGLSLVWCGWPRIRIAF